MVKIIAEIGSNWRNLDDCLHSIAMAKAAGADAVKFQLFDAGALYGYRTYQCQHNPPCMDGKGGQELVNEKWVDIPPLHRNFAGDIGRWVDKYAFPEIKIVDGQPVSDYKGCLHCGYLPALKTKADQVGIEFMCSAFSPELIGAVDPFVSTHKVASAELTHVRMLERLAAIGKPVILSTGASGEYDIEMALKTLGQTPVTLLYCVSAYPARAVELDVIRLLAERFKKPVGFSDHTTDYLTIPKLAVQMGACVIEKHMTDIPEVETPDRPHSLTVDEFKRMVETIRGTRKPFIGYTPEENEMVLKHNRRLVATQDIGLGEVLAEGKNFGIYRSLKADTHGMSPWAIGRVHGKLATRAISAGDGIGPEDFR